MSVKSFKFVSPGIFINEIDDSFIPKAAEAIGPVVIGRSTRGLAMQPTKVQSYSEFVELFGDTVPGFAGGDIYRDGNFQSPMYGTYAAKAFLKANVAPLTYIRLLGQQHVNKTSTTTDAAAGWRTNNTELNVSPPDNGGAFGLWVFHSQSATAPRIATGSLAAVWYLADGYVALSGNIYGGAGTDTVSATTTAVATASANVLIGTDTTYDLFTLVVSTSLGGSDTIRFGLDDSNENFVRQKFNTNPQLVSGSTFYLPGLGGSGSATGYWLGETYEQEIRNKGLNSSSIGCLMAIRGPGGLGPFNMKAQASNEARSPWFIGQHLGTPTDFVPFRQQKLFRLMGRGHGEWLHKNCKVSISEIRRSTTTTTDYGTFSVLIRALNDTDSNVQILERFDNLNLDPASPNYIARVIGDKYTEWNTDDKVLRTYGDYDNKSKYVYVEMDPTIEAGGASDGTIPFGYFGPPRFRTVYDLTSTGACSKVPGQKYGDGSELDASFFVTGGVNIPTWGHTYDEINLFMPGTYLSGGPGLTLSTEGGPAEAAAVYGSATGSLQFPAVMLRTSGTDGGHTNVTDAYYGMQTTRTATTTDPSTGIADFHRLLYAGYSAGGGHNAILRHNVAGVEDWAYVFSLDDIVLKASTNDGWYYSSGSRARETSTAEVFGDSYTSSSYADLLDAQINRFTAPFFGGFDGFDIMKPDPLYNNGLGSTEQGSYAYHTYRRAIDTVSDPEFTDMNLLTVPGLTETTLTTHMVRVCEERADALALIDLPNVYTPAAEAYKASKASRLGSVLGAANALRDRRIDSSYGCTFFPWVQTRDDAGRMLWIPPSVAMLGVMGSSERAADVWFAPAGFNRGGLSEGAAGIPITGVTQRLTSKERDTLYEANINPIASFPSSGIVVFGQKTLQERRSALDRINVRRLVIYMKKQISILSTQILFEPNVKDTWLNFTSLVNPFLANMVTSYGITDYRLVLDESTTTPDLIDQNILYAKIMVKPARAIEYIAIDFVIMSTGASFDD